MTPPNIIIPCNLKCYHRSTVMIERNEHYTYFCLRAVKQKARPPMDEEQNCLWRAGGDE